jgi:hypothetical protein
LVKGINWVKDLICWKKLFYQYDRPLPMPINLAALFKKDVAQVVEYIPNKSEALSSNPTTRKKKKEERKAELLMVSVTGI